MGSIYEPPRQRLGWQFTGGPKYRHRGLGPSHRKWRLRFLWKIKILVSSEFVGVHNLTTSHRPFREAWVCRTAPSARIMMKSSFSTRKFEKRKWKFWNWSKTLIKVSSRRIISFSRLGHLLWAMNKSEDSESPCFFRYMYGSNEKYEISFRNKQKQFEWLVGLYPVSSKSNMKSPAS